jgi:hypothetical protein
VVEQMPELATRELLQPGFLFFIGRHPAEIYTNRPQSYKRSLPMIAHIERAAAMCHVSSPRNRNA